MNRPPHCPNPISGLQFPQMYKRLVRGVEGSVLRHTQLANTLLLSPSSLRDPVCALAAGGSGSALEAPFQPALLLQVAVSYGAC